MPSSPPPELRLGFRRHLRPEVVSGEATYLISEHEITALSHPLLEVLAPLLDGSRGRDELARDAPAGLSREHIDAIVAGLSEAGLIGVTGPGYDAPDTGYGEAVNGEIAYWDAAGLDGASAHTRLATRTVELMSVGDAPLDGLRQAMAESGPALADRAGSGDLTVVVCTDYLDPALRDLDVRLRAEARPWLLARPVGTRAWVGPFFEPDGTCWHCLERRLWDNRRAEAHVQARLGRSGPAARPVTGIGASRSVAYGLIALEAAKWLAGHRHPGQRAISTLDTMTLDSRRHDVRQRPQCPHCGSADLVARRARQPIVLEQRPATFTGGNGHRARSPEATLAAYGHLIDPLTGVVTDVRRDPRGPGFFNSFVAGTNPAAEGGLDGMRAALRSSSGGKGASPEQARVSALCEALERYSARSQGDECRVRGSYAELAGADTPAVHPDACQLWDPRQFADRVRWNGAHSPLQYICEPFDTDRVVDWTPVWSMTDQRHRLLPTGMLYFGAAAPGVRADSNGTAAGSSLEDAVLQGALELLERDAVAIWWYDRSRVPGVDLESFDDPWIAELQAVHASLGRRVWALDVSADLGVPVFAAISQRVSGDAHETMFGFGAHLDATVALRRALSELNQMMPPLLDPERTADLGDPDIASWFGSSRDEHRHLRADPDVPARLASDYESQSTLDLRADVEVVHGRLRARGLELLVLDQTRPDIGLPVVKVIVPGLRSMWTRFAPGRLFDVPVALGRREAALSLDELNPVPMFL